LVRNDQSDLRQKVGSTKKEVIANMDYSKEYEDDLNDFNRRLQEIEARLEKMKEFNS